MATAALIASPAQLTRRAASPRAAPTVLVRAACRPRGYGPAMGASPFFRMQGTPFFGWQQQYGRGPQPLNSQQAWQEMFQAAEKAFGPNSAQNWQRAAETTMQALAFPVDVVESETEYVLTADVPGLAKGDLKITVNEEARTLTLSGERRRAEAAPASKAQSSSDSDSDSDSDRQSREEGEQSAAFQGRRTFERRMGKFERTFNLSEKADPSAVSARVERGVLTLTILKKERDAPQVKDVPIWD